MPSRPIAAWLLLGAASLSLATHAPAQTVRQIRLTAKVSDVEIEAGKTARGAWLYDGSLPGPMIRLREGERVRVTILNLLPEPTTVHWHGLPLPMAVDGVPGISQGPIGVGQEYSYEFTARDPGTYWYHPHVDLQIDRGLVGALLVDPKDTSEDPPFDREHVLLVDDWLAGAPVAGRDPVYADYLINGRTSRGQKPLAVKKGETVRLRILNVSGHTNYVFTVDGHPMTVTHADGQPVRPVAARAIPIGVGERWDVYLQADNPGMWSVAFAALDNRQRTLVRAVLAYDGAPGPEPTPDYLPPDLAGAPLLSYAQLASKKSRGGITPQPDLTYPMTLMGGMMSYVWTINGQAFPNADPVPVRYGANVRFQVLNRSMSEHPMHLHGHFFKLLGTAGGDTMPLVKDTVLVPRGTMMWPGRQDFEFVADNPGRWPWHCHMIYHMAAGMMRLVRYEGADSDGDGLADGDDFDPAAANAAVWTVGAGGYRPGTTVDLVAQSRPQELVLWFAGPEQIPALSLGELGMLHVTPLAMLGSALSTANREASLPLPLPPDARLSGLRVGLQAVSSNGLLVPPARLSQPAILRIR